MPSPSVTRPALRLVLAAGFLCSLTALGGCRRAPTRPVYRNTAIALVQSPVPIDENNPDSKTRLQYFNVVADALTRAGVIYHVLSEQEVAQGALDRFAVAIFPYVYSWKRETETALLRYLRSGGKVFACYRLPDSLAKELGVKITGARFDSGDHFDRCVLSSPGLPGAPEAFIQHSWHVMLVQPDSPDARVLYAWQDADGKGSGEPALILSRNGAYMSHVFTKTDREEKASTLVALLGYFLPGIWQKCAQRAVMDVGRIGTARNLAELRSLVAEAQEQDRAKGADEFLDDVEDLVGRAEQAAQHARYARSIHLSMAAHRLAVYAYVRALPTRTCEMRGVWISNPQGIKSWGWDRTIRQISRMGFNAVFAFMGSAVEAAYPSVGLPRSPAAKDKDRLAECLEACQEYNVECHVWKYIFYPGRLSPELYQRLRAEQRLQVDRYGNTVPWLCPSDPRNFELERKAIVEIARNYDVDGIHLDYIRFPNVDCCYCPRCKRLFEAALGLPFPRWPQQLFNSNYYGQYRRWRRDFISRFVRTVHAEVESVRPEVKVSAAVMPSLNVEADRCGQEWQTWVQRHFLSFVCPMDYALDVDYFRRLVRSQVQHVNGEVPVYLGLASWLAQDLTDLAEQIRLAHDLGADGYVLFHGEDLTLVNDWMPELRNGPTTINAVTPHSGPPTGLRFTAGVTPGRFGWEAVRGKPVTVAAWVARRAGVRNARLQLQYLDGTVAEQGPWLRLDRRREAEFTPPPGEYRPAIVGRVRSRPFESRGRILRVLEPGER